MPEENPQNPTPEVFDKLAMELCAHALENIDEQIEKFNLLPLIFQGRAVVAGILAHALRHAMQNMAEWTEQGIDIRQAAQRPHTLPGIRAAWPTPPKPPFQSPPEETPPSPL